MSERTLPYKAIYIRDGTNVLIGEKKEEVALSKQFLKLNNEYLITGCAIHTWHTLVQVQGSDIWLSNLRFKESVT